MIRLIGIAFGLTACTGVVEGVDSPPPPTPEPSPVAPPSGCIEVRPLVVDLGERRLDSPIPAVGVVTIRNSCDERIGVTSVGLAAGTTFRLADDSDAPPTLDPGEVRGFTIEAIPTGYGTFADQFTVASNDVERPFVAAIVQVASVCTSLEVDVDTDRDSVPDACDICADGDDELDEDADGVPDACDACEGEDDGQDADGDTVPDACDVCAAGDDTLDGDEDTIPDACDACIGGDDLVDADGDTVADACDVCATGDDRDDLDGDGTPDACERCPGSPDSLDADFDTVPDGCDVCASGDDRFDADLDGVPDDCDVCALGDDALDTDQDGVPNDCDRCSIGPDALDADLDQVPDACDVCAFGDDNLDADADGVPDACDTCALGDDAFDDDGDGVANACDRCLVGDDGLDGDADGVPDACDRCDPGDDSVDADADTVPDACDVCDGGDDTIDGDGEGVPDACDICPGASDLDDGDLDGVPDGCDRCLTGDDSIDIDLDAIPDACDVCLRGDDTDTDGDGNPDACDACEGFDDNLDGDGDTIPDGCDLCAGDDDRLDVDFDTVPDGCDVCFGRDDLVDVDGDGVPDACDPCLLGNNGPDADGDGVADACDRCSGFDDAIDIDRDGFPDSPSCDVCAGPARTDTFPTVTPPKADILFVVDDSPGGFPSQTALANSFPAFRSALDAGPVDWRIGVITTSDASLRGGPIDSGSPDPASEFATQVMAGNTGNFLEMGIERAYEATRPGGDAAPGGAWLRPDSRLVLVFFSGGVDQSTITPADAISHWQSIRGNDPDRVLAHGILTSSFMQGYPEVISLSGGVLANVLGTSSLDPAMADLGAATTLPLIFDLPEVPVFSTLEVRDDGSLTDDWHYDAATNAIVFDNWPSAGSVVSADYVEDCDGDVGGCSDGIDNDGDGLVDFPDDPGCWNDLDANENDPFFAPVCADGVDNDADGTADYPGDGQCRAASDRFESCDFIDEDLFGYVACTDSGPVCPDLSASSTALPLGNDDALAVPLGFTFDFYGRPYTSVFVGANGTLSFERPLSPSQNVCLSSAPSALDQTIFAWWDDLSPSGGDVWTRTSGVAPRRSFEVHWRVEHFNVPNNQLDIRAVLHEDTGDIDVCYVDAIAGTISNGVSATAGLEGPGGQSLEASCVTANLTSGSVIRYLHP